MISAVDTNVLLDVFLQLPPLTSRFLRVRDGGNTEKQAEPGSESSPISS